MVKQKASKRVAVRLYVREGKRIDTYFTVTRANKKISLGHDLAEAKKRLLEIEGLVAPPNTVAELIDDYLRLELRPLVAKGLRSTRTLSDRETEAVNLKHAFGKMRATDLIANHIWRYLHEFRGRSAPVRANREITFLSAVYNWAKDQKGAIQHNPCAGVTKNEEAPRTRLVSDDELADFVALARADGDVSTRAALAFVIAYLTGKAQAQILGLSRGQLKGNGIEFLVPRKKGASVLVYWSDDLRAAVDESLEMPSRITPMHVVHTQDGGRYTKDGFKKGWQLLMAKWVAAGGTRFTFHDSRAMAITTMKDEGRVASELTGHRQEATVSRVYDRRRVRKSAPVR